MKKLLSFALAAVMMLSAVIITPAFDYDGILDAHNVGITAKYFGGQLYYSELAGTFADGIETMDPVVLKDGDASQGVLNLDGIIEDGEWTDVVYHISSDNAVNNGGLSYGANALFEVPSAENSYYYYQTTVDRNGNKVNLAPADGLSYDIRFMWDEDFLYIAVETLDVDNIINQGNSAVGDNWDGDAFQFRIDPNGPNAIVGGYGYDASVDSFPYDKEIHGDVDNTLNCTYPWSNDLTEYSVYGGELHSTLGNIVVSHHTGGGYTDTCDASLRYFPEPGEPIENEDGTVTETTIWHCADASCYGDLDESKYIWASCLPTKVGGTWSNPVCETVYEIAVPWDIIAIEGQKFAPAVGDVLGISTVLFNRAYGQSSFNSYLEWGSGLCGYFTRNMPEVCGGSNALILEGESFNIPTSCAHEFAPANCLDPEICVNCGYERGFSAGHKYTFFNERLPDSYNDGTISAKCPDCGDTYTQIIPANAPSVKWDFNTTDNMIWGHGFNNGFTDWWETIDPDTGLHYEEGDDRKQILWNPDGSAKNSFDNTTFGYAVADLTIPGQTGTYFEADSLGYASFTAKTDVYFTSLDDLTYSLEDYNPFFGQWFGGNAVDYAAGLVKADGEYYFAIYPSHLMQNVTYEELSQKALCIKKATAEQIATDIWHEYVFFYDNETNTAMLFWDRYLVASATDYHFNTYSTTPILRRFHFEMYLKDIEIGSSGLASTYISRELPPPGPSLKGDVNSDGVVNGKDSFYLKCIIKGSVTSYSPEADVNNDGAITAYDSYMLRLYIVNLSE